MIKKIEEETLRSERCKEIFLYKSGAILPNTGMEFYPVIWTKIECHPFIRKERYPLTSILTALQPCNTLLTVMNLKSSLPKLTAAVH